MNRISLLDGTELDGDSLLSSDPTVLAVDNPALTLDQNSALVFDARFGEDSLPSWLTYSTDSGPASPAIGGFADPSITLETDGSTDGTWASTVLQAPEFNFSDFSEVHIYASATARTGTMELALTDDRQLAGTTEGFRFVVNDGGGYPRVVNGGSNVNDTDGTISNSPQRFGFSLRQHGDDPQILRWYQNGQIIEEWPSTDNWPTPTMLRPTVGVREQSGSSSVTLDRFLIVLQRSDSSTGGGEIITDAPDQQNLLAHWDFSEASANDGEEYTTVADLSGNGHALTGQGATHATDGINGLPAAHFDGADDVIYGPHTSELDIRNDDVVKSVYMVWQSLDTSQNGYVMAQTTTGSRTLQGFSLLFQAAESRVDFSLGGDLTGSVDILDTAPHTTAALIDRPNGEATVSWDGTTATTTTGTATSGETDIRLGARSDSSAGDAAFFNGYIGEILIYDGRHDTATHDDVMNYLSRWTA